MQLQQLDFSDLGRRSETSATASASNSASGTSQAGARKLLLSTVWAALGQQGEAGAVRDIASALRSSLAAGLASGKDVTSDLAKTIDDALTQAAQKLQDQGVDASQVDTLVANFRRDLSHALDDVAQSVEAASAAAAAPASGTRTSASAVAMDQERATFRILTTEGDQVTVRLRQQDGVSVTATQSQDASGTSTSTQATLVSVGKLQVEIDGNLSDAELKAVGDVLSQIDALATKFFSGDVQGAFAAAASIGTDPAEIAGFSVAMSYTRQVGLQSAVSASDAVPASGAAPATVAGPSTPPAQISVASTPAASGTQGAAPAIVTSLPAGTSAAASASVPAGTSVPATPVTATNASSTPGTEASGAASAASPLQTIVSFMQDVLAKLGPTTSGTTAMSISMGWKLEVLAQSLPAYAPSKTDSTSPATRLAADALTQVGGL